MEEKKKKEKPAYLIARAKSKFMTYTVKEADELLPFLMKYVEGANRTTAKSLLSNRQVLVENIITTQFNTPLKPGMKVQISKEKGKKEFKSNYFKILFEDAYLLVVDKREGIATISQRPRERSVYNIICEYIAQKSKHRRAYIINKVDKEASGLVIFAKDEKTKINFQDRWNELIKVNRYVALLEGELEKDNGVVTSWLQDDKIQISHTPVTATEGRSYTQYKTIKRANGYSLVELEIGRKNQIRMHAQELGHPVVGDDRYFKTESAPLNRLALHAFRLQFHHPVTGEMMRFETPYPTVFRKVVLRGQE
ncbi:RluA family pseudouridine synthase [Bacteroides sp. 214]|uniref:RluA family pseudouridine synthase n=1 Tax=Bacteroides sp. 214 TaxID=2302935 RepID=UPI0013D4FC74|nr:RluA family pseudouridine synthase [Bacteroides sp. 214]NDW12692.1 RluA family pseudouridine synthase [Bacteroides sp. 214]